MRNRHLIIFAVLINSFLCAQISVKLNLPAEIKTNSEINFDARVWKGPIKNFSKYQIEVPQGVKISEVDCRSGSFTQEGDLVKIIWAITPTEPEYTIALKLSSEGVKGEKTITHKYYYLEKGEKREIEMAPVTVTFVDELSTPLAGTTAPTQPAEAESPAPAQIPNQEELKQQVSQLKNDSKEALEVGGKEQQAAAKRLEEANEAVKKAKAISNEKERSKALQKAMEARSKAESDLAIANRILTLAKTLEDNAAEIEKLNQSLDSVGINDQRTSQLTNSAISPGIKSSAADTSLADIKVPVDNANVEKAKQNALRKGAKEAKGLYKPISVNGNNAKEAIQQVAQIKKDSQDAHEVGLREKKKAEQKLTEAYEALKKAEYISDPEEKKLLVEKATADKSKAEKDLEVASKILTLAKSLENNALEIERLNNVSAAEEKTVSPVNVQPELPVAASNPASSGTVTGNDGSGKQSAAADVDKLTELFKDEKKEEPKPVKTESKSAGTAGLVYRLQIGAFAKDPDKTQFVSIGKVSIVKEGAMFKAFYGNFASREEAIVKRDQLKTKGFDGFVVMFKDGVKVK